MLLEFFKINNNNNKNKVKTEALLRTPRCDYVNVSYTNIFFSFFCISFLKVSVDNIILIFPYPFSTILLAGRVTRVAGGIPSMTIPKYGKWKNTLSWFSCLYSILSL